MTTNMTMTMTLTRTMTKRKFKDTCFIFRSSYLAKIWLQKHFPDRPHCRADQVQVYGVARFDRVRISCEVGMMMIDMWIYCEVTQTNSKLILPKIHGGTKTWKLGHQHQPVFSSHLCTNAKTLSYYFHIETYGVLLQELRKPAHSEKRHICLYALLFKSSLTKHHESAPKFQNRSRL